MLWCVLLYSVLLNVWYMLFVVIWLMLLLLWVMCCMLFLCYDLDDTCRFLLYLCCDTWFMLFMWDMLKSLIVVVLLHMLHDVFFCYMLHILARFIICIAHSTFSWYCIFTAYLLFLVYRACSCVLVNRIYPIYVLLILRILHIVLFAVYCPSYVLHLPCSFYVFLQSV